MIYLHTYISLAAILLTLVYVKVFRALARRKRELQLNGSDFLTNSAHVLERERKMTIAIIMILGLSYISYVPLYLVLHLRIFCTSCYQSTTFHKIGVALSRFWYINSAINPFVYAWRLPKYCQIFIGCWKMCLVKFRVTPYQAPLSSQNQTGKERHEGILQRPEQIRESVHNAQEDSFETHL